MQNVGDGFPRIYPKGSSQPCQHSPFERGRGYEKSESCDRHGSLNYCEAGFVAAGLLFSLHQGIFTFLEEATRGTTRVLLDIEEVVRLLAFLDKDAATGEDIGSSETAILTHLGLVDGDGVLLQFTTDFAFGGEHARFSSEVD